MNRLILISMLSMVAFMCSCRCHAKKEAAMAPTTAAAQRSPCDAAAMSKGSQTFPMGAEAGAIQLEKMAPAEVVANQAFDYRIKVTNLSDHPLHNVTVKDRIPQNLVFKDSTPEMVATPEGRISWSLGTLEPKASRIISVTAFASGSGSISSCAEVTYDRAMCASIDIVQPNLTVKKDAPSQTLVCDRIPINYVVTNNGSGHACDIVIEDKLPEGLMTSDGKDTVKFNLASLGPGQSHTFEVVVDASKPGKYSSSAIASSRNLRVESNTAMTAVSQPVLTISQSGPSKEYVGRPITYDITITNKGDGIAKDTLVEAWLPDDVRFESATESGKFTRSSPGKVTWNLGTVGPNESRKVSLTFLPDQSGSIGARVVAKAYCADSVTYSAETTIAGIPGILLEVGNQTDPVQIGQNETYNITVTNQGSATDSNIRISCELEDGMQYVSSSGPTTGTLSGNKIEFAPLGSLSPNERASWQVIIKAASTGDMRFKVNLTTNQLTRPVLETEATNFYQ